jgi:hypothetical protein
VTTPDQKTGEYCSFFRWCSRLCEFSSFELERVCVLTRFLPGLDFRHENNQIAPFPLNLEVRVVNKGRTLFMI